MPEREVKSSGSETSSIKRSPVIRVASRMNTGIKESDTALQLLGITAHWGRNSRTGQAIWSELGKNLPLDVNIDSLNADHVRSAVEKAEVDAGRSDSTARALLVSTQSWQMAWRFRDERLKQARLTFVITLVCVVLGVLILLTGILFSLLGRMQVGIVTFVSAVGVFVEFVGAILLWVHRSATRRLDAEAAVAHELERIHLGIAILNEIGDPVVRNQGLRSLARNVREHASTAMVPDSLPSFGKKQGVDGES